MRPNSQKKRTNQKGAVIVTAVAVLIIMSILMTATISYVSVNRKKTNDNYCHKQAYLTASTTLKGLVTQIENATGTPVSDGADGKAKSVAEQIQNINNLKALAAANGGKGTTVPVTYNGEEKTDYKIGTTQVNIAQENGSEDNLVVTAYTTYAGVTEKVAAHISMTSKKKPARFTNTIEQIGTQSMDIDNLNVIGDTAVLDNSNTTKKYALQNGLELQGSLYIWGSVDGTQLASKYKLEANILDNERGSFVQISEDYYNFLIAQANVKRGDGYNYVFVNGTCYTPTVRLGVDNSGNKIGDGYQVDLITHGVEAKGGGSNWVQYGNVYCYDIDPNQNFTTRNGDFKISGGEKVNIEGNVYIEGDLVVEGGGTELKINGELHVAGNITGSYTATGGTFKGANAKIEKSGRGAVPTMEYTSEDYKYMPEDFFMNRDSMSNGNFKTAYYALSSGSNSKDMFRDFGTYTDSEKGVTCNFHVTENCSINGGDFVNQANGGNVNNKGVKMDCARVVLIDVDDSTGDIMIMLKNGVVLARDTEIIVRNRSTKKPNPETGIMEPQYNCYFVSDSGTNIAADGQTANGVAKHKGSTPGYFSYECLCIYDYDTYVRMFDSSYYKAKNAQGYATRDNIQNVQPKSTFVYNPTHDDSITIEGKDVYCPGSSSIIFMIGEGFSFGPPYDPTAKKFADGSGSTNNSFIEATVYAPQGYFGMKTQHIRLQIVNSLGKLYSLENSDLRTLGCGVFIAKVFNSQNKGMYVYTEPSGNSVLSNAKGSKEANITGFSLDRYDHY